MSAMNPDYVPLPTPDGREGIRDESLKASYTLVGFANALQFENRGALALISTAQPYTPRAPDATMHILKDVVRANLTIAFRALHVFREFADLDDFWKIVADVVGWQRRYFSIIVHQALNSRVEYVEKEGTDQFSPSVGEVDKVLPRLVDAFHETKASPVQYPMTANRQRYLDATKALFSQMLTEDPSTLLRQGTPDPPVFKREDMDWLNMANLPSNSEHSSQQASSQQNGADEDDLDPSPIDAMAHEDSQDLNEPGAADAMGPADGDLGGDINGPKVIVTKEDLDRILKEINTAYARNVESLKTENAQQLAKFNARLAEQKAEIDALKGELNFGLGRLETINAKTWSNFRIQKSTNKRRKDANKKLEARIRALEGKSRRQVDASAEEQEIASEFEDPADEPDEQEPEASEYADSDYHNGDSSEEEEETGPPALTNHNTRGAAASYGERRTRAGRAY